MRLFTTCVVVICIISVAYGANTNAPKCGQDATADWRLPTGDWRLATADCGLSTAD